MCDRNSFELLQVGVQALQKVRTVIQCGRHVVQSVRDVIQQGVDVERCPADERLKHACQ
ncbi:hypothetical protein [Streptomyces sp. NEAU-S7GS2]|uniref:hypothetical protein n=1 Tax=Streptomyces sp. NEAU-S7GS2 TaxID=2202000 RepID=UPI0013A591F7|nr:hypothetical protein [Streptomyces sp. NEAU-S7GS2]